MKNPPIGPVRSNCTVNQSVAPQESQPGSGDCVDQ